MPDGLALSLRNVEVEESAREQARTLSAALTAGAHAAEAGAEQVLAVVTTVLDAAGIHPAYVELRGLDLGPAPAVGDARLFVAANLGGVRLTDNVGLPLGIGFRNIEAQAEESTLWLEISSDIFERPMRSNIVGAQWNFHDGKTRQAPVQIG